MDARPGVPVRVGGQRGIALGTRLLALWWRTRMAPELTIGLSSLLVALAAPLLLAFNAGLDPDGHPAFHALWGLALAMLAGSSLAVYAANQLPNCPQPVESALANLILKSTDLRVWSYWRTLNLIGNFDANPDPIVRDNIMLSAYVADQINLYEAATGSTRFDEPGSLTFVWKDGRTYEYDHHYGLRIAGKAVPELRTSDGRSQFVEAFHALLHHAALFYPQDDDTTVIADGFPVLNALREVHLLTAKPVMYIANVAEGAGEDDPNLGLIRHHLALAYEASGDLEAARRAVDKAIEAHRSYVEAQKARGMPVGSDPAWFADARELRERL